MGCKCSNDEHNSEVLSLDVNMAYNKTIPNGKCIEHLPIENKSLFEENNFGTSSKFGSANNNEDSATTAKSKNDLDRRILSEAIFKEINSARTNPREYIKKVKSYKSKIYNENNQYYFKISENSSIKLRSGQEAFDNCISFLDKQEPLKPLNLVDCVKLDDFSYFSNNSNIATNDSLIDECTSLNFLSTVIENKIQEIKDKYEMINFHYDKNIFSPELSVISQIVDDTSSNYERRKNIFNSETDTIGINSIKINLRPSLYCIYLVFAKKIGS